MMDSGSFSQQSTQQMRTQEMTDSQALDPVSLDPHIWGRLLSRKIGLPDYNLSENKHTFGRASGDHCFTEDHFTEKQLLVLSKVHFIITRESDPNGAYIVILEDKSVNGTYVNDTLIGRYSKVVLQSSDEICLANPRSKAFVFYNYLKNDADKYPTELTNKYTMTKRLGDGTFGEVRLAYAVRLLQRVAVKIMKKTFDGKNGNAIKPSNVDTINNEIKLLQSIQHPCIVKLLDIIDGDDKIYIVMELAEGGELFKKLKTNGKLKEPIAKIYFYQLILAIQYLHSKQITHRDIKPENILLATDDEISTIKLADFGLSKLAEEMSSMCGTQDYCAPELLNVNVKTYTNKVDMWSLGVALYTSLSGGTPFNDESACHKKYKIVKGIYTMEHVTWQGVTAEAKDLVRKLIVVDPTKRLSAEEAVQHRWFEDPEMKFRVEELMWNSALPSVPKRPRDNDDVTLENKVPRIS